MGKIEGAANQLRGTLFEYLAADILRKAGAHQVRMNRIFKQEAKEAEADVIAVRDNLSLTFIECKGHSPYGETPHYEVEKWLQHNVPIFFKSAREHDDWKNLPVHFEFWTTAPLTEESIQFLEKAKASIKPTRYTIGWRLGPEVLKICQETRDSGLINAFRKHFMKYNSKSAAIAEAIWPKRSNT